MMVEDYVGLMCNKADSNLLKWQLSVLCLVGVLIHSTCTILPALQILQAFLLHQSTLHKQQIYYLGSSIHY